MYESKHIEYKKKLTPELEKEVVVTPQVEKLL